jgi:hypothetical protein
MRDAALVVAACGPGGAQQRFSGLQRHRGGIGTYAPVPPRVAVTA